MGGAIKKKNRGTKKVKVQGAKGRNGGTWEGEEIELLGEGKSALEKTSRARWLFKGGEKSAAQNKGGAEKESVRRLTPDLLEKGWAGRTCVSRAFRAGPLKKTLERTEMPRIN